MWPDVAPLISTLRWQRQLDIHEFEASLFYVVIIRTVRNTSISRVSTHKLPSATL